MTFFMIVALMDFRSVCVKCLQIYLIEFCPIEPYEHKHMYKAVIEWLYVDSAERLLLLCLSQMSFQIFKLKKPIF